MQRRDEATAIADANLKIFSEKKNALRRARRLLGNTYVNCVSHVTTLHLDLLTCHFNARRTLRACTRFLLAFRLLCHVLRITGSIRQNQDKQ